MKAAQYAARLRKQRRDGALIDVDDIAWLSQYESTVKRGRKASIPIRPPLAPETTPHPSSSPAPQGDEEGGGTFSAGTDDLPPPPPVDFSRPTEGADDMPGAGPTSKTQPPPSGSADPKYSAEHIESCKQVAAMYGAWLLSQQRGIADAGLPAIPPPVIQSILVPCAYRVALKWMPEIENVYLDAVATGGAGIYTLVAVRRIRSEKEKKTRGDGKHHHGAAVSGNVIDIKPPAPKEAEDTAGEKPLGEVAKRFEGMNFGF